MKGVASQTANLQQWQNSVGTVLGYRGPRGAVSITPIAVAAGETAWTLTPGAHTLLTAEVLDVNLAAHTVTLADTTTIALARSVVLGATTYNGVAAGGAEIVTTAINLEVALPVQGTNLTITNAPIAHLAVVWAKLDGEQAEHVRGFIVERGTPGFQTAPIRLKMSMRASYTGEIVLSDCKVPKEALLPQSKGLGSPLACLNQARLGIAWGAIGAAKACYHSTIEYTRARVQFGKPIAGKQLIQEQLVDMATEIVKADLMNLHFSRLKDAGKLTPYHVSLAKKNSVGQALRIARMARALHGANGISLEYAPIRHMLNLESVYTYEGTNEVHSLIVGRGLTGLDAF